MIRLINLTGQILIDDDEPHFAWFDTVTNEFIKFNDSQDWHSWREFEEDLLTVFKGEKDCKEVISRFKRLFQFESEEK